MTTVLPLTSVLEESSSQENIFLAQEVGIVSSYLLYVLVQERYNKNPITHKKFM